MVDVLKNYSTGIFNNEMMLNCVNNIHLTDKLKDGMTVNYAKHNIKTLIKIPDVSRSFCKIHSLNSFSSSQSSLKL